MSVIQKLSPEEVWEYWEDNKGDILGRLELIAEHENFGMEIYLTADSEDGPSVEVYHDDVRIYEEYIINERDCLKTIKKVYDEYLEGVVPMISSSICFSDEDDGYDEAVRAEDIEEREDELDDLVYEFCTGVMGFNSNKKLDDEAWEDIKDHFLEYLHRKHGISIYRPMYLEDENGEEFYEEYPYECMIFEDEDNPVYKQTT